MYLYLYLKKNKYRSKCYLLRYSGERKGKLPNIRVRVTGEGLEPTTSGL